METNRKIIAGICREIIAELDTRITKSTDKLEILEYRLKRAKMHDELINQTDITQGELNRWNKDLKFIWQKLQKDVYQSIEQEIEARQAELNYSISSDVILGEIYHEHDVKVAELERILIDHQKYFDVLVQSVEQSNDKDSLQMLERKLLMHKLRININAKKNFIESFKKRKVIIPK